MTKLDHITETYYEESFLKMDGFDTCIIGMDQTNLIHLLAWREKPSLKIKFS